MTYQDLFRLIKDTPHSEFKEVGDSVNYKVVVDDAERVVRLLFEESAGRRDWQKNFDFPARLYKNQQNKFRVARGWGRSWKTANDEVMKDVMDAMYDTPNYYQLQIIGWSQGGGYALLAAEDFCFRTGRKADVITFGAPKIIFGRESRRLFNRVTASVCQFAHKMDIVAYCIPLPFYYHLNKINVGRFRLRDFIPKFFNGWFHTRYDEYEMAG